MDIPQKYRDVVATIQNFKGPLFDRNEPIPPTQFLVLDIRMSNTRVVDIASIRKGEEPKYVHP